MAARKHVSPGQIINALRKAEVGIANGKTIKGLVRCRARSVYSDSERSETRGAGSDTALRRVRVEARPRRIP